MVKVHLFCFLLLLFSSLISFVYKSLKTCFPFSILLMLFGSFSLSTSFRLSNMYKCLCMCVQSAHKCKGSESLLFYFLLFPTQYQDHVSLFCIKICIKYCSNARKISVPSYILVSGVFSCVLIQFSLKLWCDGDGVRLQRKCFLIYLPCILYMKCRCLLFIDNFNLETLTQLHTFFTVARHCFQQTCNISQMYTFPFSLFFAAFL